MSLTVCLASYSATSTSETPRRSLREDIDKTVHITWLDDVLACLALRLEPTYQLGPQDVDLAVQDPSAIRDALLLFVQLVEHLSELLVGLVPEVEECVVHRAIVVGHVPSTLHSV